MTMGFTPHVAPAKKSMQVRFFSGGDVDELQQQINKWLREHPDREIVDVRQSVGKAILVSVWYIDYSHDAAS